jgi:hypothetical protein
MNKIISKPKIATFYYLVATQFRNGKNIISNFHFRNDFLFR